MAIKCEEGKIFKKKIFKKFQRGREKDKERTKKKQTKDKNRF